MLRSASLMSSSAPSRRILLIAASDNFRRTISRILCRCGYAIDVACSGEEAVEALDRESYDLVLSEVLLPGMCGLTVVCTARQHGRNVPFVLLSETETERMRWIVSGVEGVRCLPLPVDVDQLKRVLADAFQPAS
jgi:CheY-like chemotaxis protein